MQYEPTVTSTVTGIVSNLRSTVPTLADVQPWRIDIAHREWSVSEDYPNEAAIVEWLPEATDENRFKYLELQQGDLKRTISELEKYNAQLHVQLREARDEASRLRFPDNTGC